MKIIIIGITIVGTLLYAQQSPAVKVGLPLIMKGIDLQQFSEAHERVSSGKDKNDAEALRRHYPDALTYIWYVNGIADALTLYGRLCLPTNAIEGQLTAVVSKYLKDNPEKWNKAGAELVSDALISVFPCKKK